MCCNVAPYQCHGLCDYFGALRSVWLLNLSPPDRSLFWKYCHSLCNAYSSISEEWTTFSAWTPKTTTMCYSSLWNINNGRSPRPDFGSWSPLYWQGLRHFHGAKTLRDVTSFMSSCLRCAIFSNGCLTAIRSTEPATNPGILCRSKSNTVKLHRWVYCCSNVASTLRELLPKVSNSILSLQSHFFIYIYCMILQHTTMQLGQVWVTKCNKVFHPISLLPWLPAQYAQYTSELPKQSQKKKKGHLIYV